MYTADYNDLYAPNFSSANDFKGVLLLDLKSNQYFDSFNPKRSVLLPSSLLQSFTLKKVTNPFKTVTFYEFDVWPSGGKYYGFVDTDAEFLKSVEGITFDPTKR